MPGYSVTVAGGKQVIGPDFNSCTYDHSHLFNGQAIYWSKSSQKLFNHILTAAHIAILANLNTLNSPAIQEIINRVKANRA